MNTLATMLKNMTKRERYSVFLAGGALVLFIIVQGIVFPYLDGKQTLERQVDRKTKDLSEMLALKSQYEARMGTMDVSRARFATRGKGFTLFTFLDALAGETGVKDHITYMKPSSSESKDGAYKISEVELKLKAVTLKQLTDYLYGVETNPNALFVKRLTVDKSAKPEGYIDVVMQVETYEKEEKS
jgi:general secretion pathway protein M